MLPLPAISAWSTDCENLRVHGYDKMRLEQALEARVEARGVSLKDLAAIDTTTEWVYGRSPTKTQADVRAASGARPT